MTTNLYDIQALNLDADIKKILGMHSEEDRETFTSALQDILKTSNVVNILDENDTSGPGSLRDVLSVCQTLGKVDASLAWVVGVANTAWSLKGCFHSLTSSSVGENRLFALVLGRPGTLKKDDASGHYRLSGEWKYASGWPYASYFFCLGAVAGTTPPDVRVLAVPAEKLELHEEWKATGLRGTQSVTIRAHDVEIPESNMEDYGLILSGKNRASSHDLGSDQFASYSHLFTGVLMNALLGPILGATEAGLEYVTELAKKRPVGGSTYQLMSDSGAMRTEIGRLHSILDIYKRAAEYNADVIDQAARDAAHTLNVQDRVDNRARATMVMRGCVDIVQDLMWIYGSSGLDRGCPLERIWRDVNVGARHGGFTKLVPEEAVGLAKLGQDPKILTRMF